MQCRFSIQNIIFKKVNSTGIKKVKKIVFRSLLGLILLLLVLGIALSLPFTQTKIAKYFVQRINKDYGIHVAIDEVAVSVFGGVKLKKVLIFCMIFECM